MFDTRIALTSFRVFPPPLVLAACLFVPLTMPRLSSAPEFLATSFAFCSELVGRRVVPAPGLFEHLQDLAVYGYKLLLGRFKLLQEIWRKASPVFCDVRFVAHCQKPARHVHLSQRVAVVKPAR